MKKWLPISLVVVVLAVAGLAFAAGSDKFDRHDRTEAGQVVTTSDGETLVIYDNDRRGFFPFGFVIFPLFWILVAGAVFMFLRQRSTNGFGETQSSRDAWLDDWHRRAHSATGHQPTDPAS